MARAGSSGRRSSPGRRDEVAHGRIQADARRRVFHAECVYFSFTARLRPRRPTPRACCPNGSSSAACRIRPVRRFVRFAPSRSPRLKAMYAADKEWNTPEKSIYARKPSLPPFCLAVRMRFWRTLPSAPISLQKSVMTCVTGAIRISEVLRYRFVRGGRGGSGRVRVSGTRLRVSKGVGDLKRDS